MGALAAAQHGVVTRAQMLGAGLTGHQVEHRAAAGRFVRLHRGVYRVGPLIAPRCREAAAALACGDRSVISHRSALFLWNLAPPAAPGEAVDVGLRVSARRRPGIRIHRLPTLRAGDMTRIDGIAVTTVARTLWDLARSAPLRDLERALAAALDRGIVRPVEVRRLLDRHAGAPGTGRLRSLVDSRPALTRSEAEELFLTLVRDAQLPDPRTNARIEEGLEVDFLWPDRRLVVEVDGYAFHSSAHAFEADRRRDGRLAAAGYVVIRVTWAQLKGEPLAVVARVAQAFAHPAQALAHPAQALAHPVMPTRTSFTGRGRT